ncbi:MAG TPA: decarboxylating 6-phosphogluconate dehydrogenase [Actinomycetota bacterium]
MRIGIVGLGRMGGNMRDRLRGAGHEVLGYERKEGHRDVASYEELVGALDPPRVAWSMVPAGAATEAVVGELAGLLSEGDLIVDGANSHFRDSMRRAGELADRGIAYVDAGVSGGVWGLEGGYGLMVGGPDDAVASISPLLDALATEGHWVHVGPSGSGHFTKMIHNGIEYGMMQAYAEGFEILHRSEDFPDIDLHAVAEAWRHGTVIRSWLLDLISAALERDPELSELAAWVDDSGFGRGTVSQAIEEAVPAPAIAAALFARFASRDDSSFAMRLVAALRREFGGHAVQPPD